MNVRIRINAFIQGIAMLLVLEYLQYFFLHEPRINIMKPFIEMKMQKKNA